MKNIDAQVNVLGAAVAKIQDELAMLSIKFNALDKKNDEMSNGLKEVINKTNAKIDTLKKDVKHDLDLHGTFIKDLNERLEVTEDTVHDIVDDLTECDNCSGCGCNCQCHEEIPTVEKVIGNADKAVDTLVEKIFNNWLDKYLKHIGSDDKLLFITWLAPIHKQLINFCIEDCVNTNIDPYELFDYIVSIGVSYDIKWNEFDGIISAMKAWNDSTEKTIVHGNWVVSRTKAQFPIIKKLQAYDC